jgi:hypothetical protein
MIKIKCPHGVETKLDLDPADRAEHTLRLVLRNTLLACPSCWFDATSVMEEPGP